MMHPIFICGDNFLKVGAVQNWLQTQPKKTFFLTELKTRVKRWNRCVEVEGDYVEK
jgi:hypothetical protein